MLQLGRDVNLLQFPEVFARWPYFYVDILKFPYSVFLMDPNSSVDIRQNIPNYIFSGESFYESI